MTYLHWFELPDAQELSGPRVGSLKPRVSQGGTKDAATSAGLIQPDQEFKSILMMDCEYRRLDPALISVALHLV
jgi:hypothetical protein